MSEHSKRAHALLSASGAHRWMNCTPSAVLESNFPDTTSEAAKEGTLAHELAEAKVMHYMHLDGFTKRKLTARKNKLKNDSLWRAEMEEYTDEYLDFIKKEALSFNKNPYVKVEEKLDLTSYVPGGFGTADCIMIADGTLHVIDLKYGKGVPVSAKDNPQLMLYALGAYKKYNFLFSIQNVKMSIVQPRIDNNSSQSMTVESLLEFGKIVKEKAEIAISGEGEYLPGEWCRFCRARRQCRARADENVKLAFAIDKKPPLLANDEIGAYLTQGEDVAKWLSDLQDYALSECLAGKSIAGYKAVEGRGSRVWNDMDKAFETIVEDGTDEALLYEKKPLSLAQVEKLIGKTHFNSMCGKYIIKKPGKPALVKESDKRPAITNIITADEAFKEV